MDFLLSNAYLAVGAIAVGVVIAWALVATAFLLLGGRRRPFLLGPAFAVVHGAVVAALAWTTPADMTATPLAGIGWLFLSVADFPATLLFPRGGGDVSLPGFFLVFGTVQHLLVGTLFAALYAVWRRKERRPA